MYGDEEELDQTIFDLMKELHEDTFTPIVKVDNQQEIVSISIKSDVEDTVVTLDKENLVSEDSTESTVHPNYVVEEEDTPLAVSGNPNDCQQQIRPSKKQKLENEVSVVNSVSTCGNVYLCFIIHELLL